MRMQKAGGADSPTPGRRRAAPPRSAAELSIRRRRRHLLGMVFPRVAVERISPKGSIRIRMLAPPPPTGAPRPSCTTADGGGRWDLRSASRATRATRTLRWPLADGSWRCRAWNQHDLRRGHPTVQSGSSMCTSARAPLRQIRTL